MKSPPALSTTSNTGRESARLYWLPLAPLNSGSELRSPRCRNDTWLESIPPSMACSQFDSCRRFETNRCRSATAANYHSGSGGTPTLAPQLVPTHPPPPAQRGDLSLVLPDRAAF